jgi:MarR family transcriptional regulator, organic hydroperoxide resistance regulator
MASSNLRAASRGRTTARTVVVRREALVRQAHGIELPPERSPGSLIRELHRLQLRLLQERLARHRVAIGAWNYLRVLWQQDGITQRELSRKNGVNEATTREGIDAMQRAGLVRRERDPIDRRSVRLRLTPRALRLKDRLLPLAIDLNHVILAGFSGREAEEFLGYLRRVRINLEQHGGLSGQPIRTSIP